MAHCKGSAAVNMEIQILPHGRFYRVNLFPYELWENLQALISTASIVPNYGLCTLSGTLDVIKAAQYHVVKSIMIYHLDVVNRVV